MSTNTDVDRKLHQTMRMAQMVTLCFATALIVWGLAPVMVLRITSGRTPAEAWSMGMLPIAMGGVFMVLGVLIGRRVQWALWGVLGLSLLLVLVTIVQAFGTNAGGRTAFALLLPGCVAVSAWLALEARRQAGRQEQPANST